MAMVSANDQPHPTYYKRLFVVCVAVRATFAYVATIDNDDLRVTIGLFALAGAFGFLERAGEYLDPNYTQKGLFNQDLWWNKMRYVHAAMYALFGAMVLGVGGRPEWAWVVLVVDVCIGIVAFLNKHWLLCC